MYPNRIQDKMDNTNTLSLVYVEFDYPVEFIQSTADTLGLVEKFGKFQLGISADETTLNAVEEISNRFGTFFPIKGRYVLYLKMRAISQKQSKELLNKGPMTVKIKFSCTRYYRNEENDKKYLVFKVNGLGKSEESNFAPNDI